MTTGQPQSETRRERGNVPQRSTRGHDLSQEEKEKNLFFGPSSSPFRFPFLFIIIPSCPVLLFSLFIFYLFIWPSCWLRRQFTGTWLTTGSNPTAPALTELFTESIFIERGRPMLLELSLIGMRVSAYYVVCIRRTVDPTSSLQMPRNKANHLQVVNSSPSNEFNRYFDVLNPNL